MASTCKNCGREIDGKSPICMYCGTAVSDSEITQETKDRMQEISKETTSNPGTSIKAFGAFLMIIGILADVVSMFLIMSDGFGAFGTITIIGTISFLIGLMLVANS